MRKLIISEERIALVLRGADSGTPVAEVFRKMGVSEKSFYCAADCEFVQRRGDFQSQPSPSG